jgi:hypothetical protein
MNLFAADKWHQGCGGQIKEAWRTGAIYKNITYYCLKCGNEVPVKDFTYERPEENQDGNPNKPNP